MTEKNTEIYEDALIDDQYLTLEWEDGSSVECEIIDRIELDGKKYIALLPKDDDQAIIFTYTEADDDIELGNLEDEEFDRVSQAFLDKFDEHEFDEDHEH